MTAASPQPAEPLRKATGPSRPSSSGAGADVGDGAVRPLVDGDVAQPLGGEPGDVVEERGGRDERLPVGGPAGPLAVRAVGRDVADVVPQAPDRRLVQPVDPVVAAGEPAGAAHVGVHDDAADVVRGQVFRVALDADVLEAVGGVPGLEDVTGDAGGDHGVDLTGRQRVRQERHVRHQVVGGDVAVRPEPFAVGQGDRRAGRAQIRSAAASR